MATNTEKQLEFPGIKLAELTRELFAVEEEKKSANEDFNAEIKRLKKEIRTIAYEMAKI